VLCYSGFDGHFLLSYILQRGIKPDVTYNGGKLMRMTVQKGLNITLLDSLLFMPLPLEALPATFDIPETKGKNLSTHPP
jgi:hypothetical protein